MGQLISAPAAPETSVIIPTFNEAPNIVSTIEAIHRHKRKPVEIIVADGFSTDRTVKLARRAGARAIRVRGGRAVQLNTGAKISRAPLLLFLHADTDVPPAFDTEASRILGKRGVVGGAFKLSVYSSSPALRIVERIANWRSSFLQRPYGDQGVFLKRNVFDQIGGFPRLPFLDDYEFSRRLARHGRIDISPKPVSTSARRWEALGIFRTTIINYAIPIAYHCGVPPDHLGKWYRNALIRANERKQL